MPLLIQIKSLSFCFIYGIFFFLILKLNHKFLFSGKIYYQIIINFLFIIDNVLLFFILIKKINEGIVHPYFFLMIFLGVIVGKLVDTKIKKGKRVK